MKPVTISQLRSSATVDLMTAARAVGLGRTKAYELARRDEFPCRVIRIGDTYRIPTPGLLELLGVNGEQRPIPSSCRPRPHRYRSQSASAGDAAMMRSATTHSGRAQVPSLAARRAAAPPLALPPRPDPAPWLRASDWRPGCWSGARTAARALRR